jgi:hypothetical protein
MSHIYIYVCHVCTHIHVLYMCEHTHTYMFMVASISGSISLYYYVVCTTHLNTYYNI